MKYILTLVKSLKEVIIVYLLELILMIVIYGFKLNNNILYLSAIILNVIIIFYFIKTIKFKKNKLSVNNYFALIYLGIGSSLFLNMLIFLMKNDQVSVSSNIILIVLSTAIVGPILEELLFRERLLNKLMKFNNKYIAVILGSITFAILHGSLINIIYAFVMGIIFNIIYLRYQNILSSIIVHISANLIVIFIIEFNLYVLMLSFIILGLSLFMLKSNVNIKKMRCVNGN